MGVPYSGIWSFWDKAKSDDEAFEQFEKEQKKARGGFAESTIQAAAWLRKFQPERLEAWYRSHPGLREAINGREQQD